MPNKYKCLICGRMFFAIHAAHHAVCPGCSGGTDVRKVDESLPCPALKTVIVSVAEYDRLLAVEKQRNEMLALLEEFVQVQPLVCDDTCDCRRSRAKRLISRAKGDG